MYGLSENTMERYEIKTIKNMLVKTHTYVNEIDYDFEFEDMKTVLDFYQYLETTFLYAIHGHPDVPISLQKERFVDFDNLLLGAPRIRQLRASSGQGCDVHRLFKKYFSTCYESYSIFRENSSSVWKGYVILDIKSYFLYTLFYLQM